jgi:hypothetical protein
VLEPDRIQQPFTNFWFVDDRGKISASIGDAHRDLSHLRVVSAAFQDASGRDIPIGRITYDPGRIYKSFTIVTFYYKAGVHAPGAPFSASIVFEVQGQTLLVTGRFSLHSHTKIEYLPEVLDHG